MTKIHIDKAVVRAALDALEEAMPHLPVHTDWHFEAAATALRQALAEAEQPAPAQEPVADHVCRRLLYGFMLDCNAVGLEQAGKNLQKGMKQAAHGITGENR